MVQRGKNRQLQSAPMSTLEKTSAQEGEPLAEKEQLQEKKEENQDTGLLEFAKTAWS